MNAQINRREFLRGSALAAVGMVAVACAKGPEATPAPTAAKPAPTEAPAKAAPTAAKAVSQYKESPMLADQVKAGKLPPIDERLPQAPMVLANALPDEWLTPETGKHGGTLRLAGPGVQYDNDFHVAHITPFVYVRGIGVGEDVNVEPQLVERFEVSPDQRVFTMTLRKGLNWSDGHPVTTRDVQFAYEDVLLNAELYSAGLPAYFRTAGQIKGDPMKLEILDDFAFRISFTGPYGGFPMVLAITDWRSYEELLKPRHYLEQFHKKYADPAKLEGLIKENKFETWVQLFNDRDVLRAAFLNARSLRLPKLSPWILVEASDERCVLERNPYYCAVDPTGQQLPYFDRVEVTTVKDLEVLALKQLAGEVDYGAETVTVPKVALYKENESKGSYNLKFGRLHRTSGVAFLNLTYKDESWRKVVRDVRFRKALSIAIDRKEIIDAVYYGYGKPSPLNPNEYDPEGAKKLLDEMGMDKKGADGFRLTPDGKPFAIEFEVRADFYDNVPATQLYVQFWKAVGINTTMKVIEPSLWGQRINANEFQATTLFEQSPQWHRQGYGQNMWGPLWWIWWRTEGKQGEEPPEDVKTFLRKREQVMVESPDEGRRVAGQCEKMIHDSIYYFVPAINQMQPRIENKKLGNCTTNEMALSICQSFSMRQMFFKA